MYHTALLLRDTYHHHSMSSILQPTPEMGSAYRTKRTTGQVNVLARCTYPTDYRLVSPATDREKLCFAVLADVFRNNASNNSFPIIGQ